MVHLVTLIVGLVACLLLGSTTALPIEQTAGNLTTIAGPEDGKVSSRQALISSRQRTEFDEAYFWPLALLVPVPHSL
jgi:hypothetical protein